VNRAVGSVDGYGYSGALVAVADVWDPEHLNGFLTNPKSYAPGTKMGFAGLKSVDDRANLIAYLATIGN
jgi:cytochrome c